MRALVICGTKANGPTCVPGAPAGKREATNIFS